MGIDAVAAIRARMAQIETRFAAPPVPPAATSPASSASSFAGALQDALGPAGGALGAAAGDVTTPATPGATLGAGHATHAHDGPLQPPPELARYGNGRIPPDALEAVGVGGHRLYAPAAQAFRQMVTDAAHAGVPIGITDSYRSYDEQVDLAERKGLYREGGLAATPGTSNHGWGLAVDLDLTDEAQIWMRTHAARYGFVEDVPREPWHWTYHGPEVTEPPVT